MSTQLDNVPPPAPSEQDGPTPSVPSPADARSAAAPVADRESRPARRVGDRNNRRSRNPRAGHEPSAAASAADLRQLLQKETARRQREQKSSEQRIERLLSRITIADENSKSTTDLLDRSRREIEKLQAALRDLKTRESSRPGAAAEAGSSPNTVGAPGIERMQEELAQERLRCAELEQQRHEQQVEGIRLRQALRQAAQDRQAHQARWREQRAAEASELKRLSNAIVSGMEAIEKRRAGMQPSNAPLSWYLKMEDQTVYGPATAEDLYAWACQCRVAPGHLVSSDGQTWVPASDLPPLHMHWKVQLIDGSPYGPINLLALQHLVQDHAAEPDAPVENRLTGEVFRAADLLSPASMEARECNLRLADELRRVRELLEMEREASRCLRQELSPCLAALRRLAVPATPPRQLQAQLRQRTSARSAAAAISAPPEPHPIPEEAPGPPS